jgi:hypothetical protein
MIVLGKLSSGVGDIGEGAKVQISVPKECVPQLNISISLRFMN